MDSGLTEVEVRCPLGAGGMFLKLLGTDFARVDSDNLIEVNCPACRRKARENDPLGEVFLVLHRFALDGEFVETEVVLAGG